MPVASIELRRPGGRQNGLRFVIDMEIHIEPITAGKPARRMQDVDMAGSILFRMKGLLHDKRANVPTAHQARLARAARKRQLQLRAPVAWACGVTCALYGFFGNIYDGVHGMLLRSRRTYSPLRSTGDNDICIRIFLSVNLCVHSNGCPSNTSDCSPITCADHD
ncbi:hypothetical protein LUX29_19050 [Aureimonas altamirensis]|uniref:hypothetical protein n=1 Tax=Aureimonas altamirensis TaxID=370622 RepID=UPI001E2B059E|nr:hypothetical protein [Aureimonas altamirensis]UHD47963.1 hypothetical protein LUX29_19050 [Aureimonas altamirensis]